MFALAETRKTSSWSCPVVSYSYSSPPMPSELPLSNELPTEQKLSLGQSTLAVVTAAIVTLFCLNIFNPLPSLFSIISELLQPIGKLMPRGWQFVPLLLFLSVINIVLASVIRQWTFLHWSSFANIFFKASMVFVTAGVLYIIMVMWKLAAMNG